MSAAMSATAFLSVAELLAAYRSRAASPVDAVCETYARIERIEPRINAFCVVAEREDVLRQARASEARWRSGSPQGELDGVPLTVKDAIIAKGWPTQPRPRHPEL